jgi:hypothetical protein
MGHRSGEARGRTEDDNLWHGLERPGDSLGDAGEGRAQAGVSSRPGGEASAPC